MGMRHQAGYSLVQFMIAAMLGLILLTGALRIMDSTRIGYRIQDGLIKSQESGRFASEIMAYDLRMAGHWGGVDASQVDGSVNITGTGLCNTAWVFNPDESIRGYEGAGTAPINCVADYVANSDVLAVRYADLNGMTASRAAGSVYVRASVGLRAEILQGNATNPSDLPDDDGTYNYPFRVSLFYLRSCSDPVSGACTDASDGVPTLWRVTLSGTSLIHEALVDGVEQLQFSYGVDSDGDRTVDRYYTATNVPDWDEVIAIEMGLVARGGMSTQGFADTTAYALPGGYSYTPASAVNLYQRKLYRQVVHVRNEVRG